MTRGSEEGFAGTAVVTGASSGIGRATAHELAARDMHLVLASRDPVTLEEAAAEAKAHGAASVAAIPTDVGVPEAVEKLARGAVEATGAIDVWVNNAAVMAYGKLGDVPPDVYRRVIEVNLFGAIEGSRIALDHFRSSGRGHLVNVGSLYARMTSPLVGPYVVSKFGLLGFTEVLRQEMMEWPNIHVSLVMPGSVDSPIFRHAANFTGRAVRPVPPVSDVRRVARAIGDLVAEPKAEVVVGNTHRVLAWANSMFPRLYGRLVPKVMDASGLEPEPAEFDTGNVFESRPEWNELRGSWSRKRDLAALARTARFLISQAASPLARPLAARIGSDLNRPTGNDPDQPVVGT